MVVTALFGVFEFGRIMWYWNAAAEATTIGARLATVCSIGSGAPRRKMAEVFPRLDDIGPILETIATRDSRVRKFAGFTNWNKSGLGLRSNRGTKDEAASLYTDNMSEWLGRFRELISDEREGGSIC